MAKQSFDLPQWQQQIEREARATRAVVLKAIFPDDPSERYPGQDPFSEIHSLAKTAGLEVVGTVSQRRRKPHPGTYVGKGKLDELYELAEELDASIILVDDPISPSQGKSIEDRTERRVIDRAELIMDIFATRANTHQAKLQVELAQLRYSQSRLTRMWTHLSRIEGGIGMRGPGETQLETDRRIIRRKIGVLRERLQEIERQHETQVKNRADAFKVALVGYTNAGKSTLMRRLTKSEVLVENRLFSTLDTATRQWPLEVPADVLLSDTVGFIRKLPHSLVASFHATLAEAREADLLLHVVDVSSPLAEDDMAVVQETLERIGCAENPTIYVFNKVDQLGDDRRIDLHHWIGEHDEGLAVSAVTGEGIDALEARVATLAQERDQFIEYRLPVSRGDLANRLRKLGRVELEEYEDDAIRVQVRLSPEDHERFERLLVREGVTQTAGDESA